MTGAPEEIRTPDPQIRSLVLYPAELRARIEAIGLQPVARPRRPLPSDQSHEMQAGLIGNLQRPESDRKRGLCLAAEPRALQADRLIGDGDGEDGAAADTFYKFKCAGVCAHKLLRDGKPKAGAAATS